MVLVKGLELTVQVEDAVLSGFIGRTAKVAERVERRQAGGGVWDYLPTCVQLA